MELSNTTRDTERPEPPGGMVTLSGRQIEAFLDRQTIGRLGCHHAGTTYVVPLVFARHRAALYVLTSEGTKTRLARGNPSVCFEVDEYEPSTGNWTSVILQGRYEELDATGKVAAIAILTKRHGFRRGPRRVASAPERGMVAFRIVIESATGRSLTR